MGYQLTGAMTEFTFSEMVLRLGQCGQDGVCQDCGRRRRSQWQKRQPDPGRPAQYPLCSIRRPPAAIVATTVRSAGDAGGYDRLNLGAVRTTLRTRSSWPAPPTSVPYGGATGRQSAVAPEAVPNTTTDLNALTTTSGILTLTAPIAAAMANRPAGADGPLVIMVTPTHQLLLSEDDSVFLRHKVGAGWGSWTQVGGSGQATTYTANAAYAEVAGAAFYDIELWDGAEGGQGPQRRPGAWVWQRRRGRQARAVPPLSHPGGRCESFPAQIVVGAGGAGGGRLATMAAPAARAVLPA